MAKNIIIGIDPGKKGGIAILTNNILTNNKWTMYPMPIIGKDIDEKELSRIFYEVYEKGCDHHWDKTFAYLEKVHAMPGQGVTSMFTFGMGYGILRGILSANWIPYQLVTPQAWKKVILAGLSKDKMESCNYVTRKFPEINLMPGKKRTPHNGIADAVCIAEYGLRLSKERLK